MFYIYINNITAVEVGLLKMWFIYCDGLSCAALVSTMAIAQERTHRGSFHEWVRKLNPEKWEKWHELSIV